MAADLDDIKKVRAHFGDLIQSNLELFEEMQRRMNSLATAISNAVQEFSQTNYVAYQVGARMGAAVSPLKKLQYVRAAIYSTARLVSDFRTDKFTKAYELQADCKSLYSTLWSQIIGDEVTMTFLSSNSEKEREVTYLLLPITKIKDSIQTSYTTSRNNTEWMAENLDQLNKIESALRLEHNMKLTLGDVGDTATDELPGLEGEGVDLMDLDTADISTPVTSTPVGNKAVMKQGYDPLVDD